MRVVPPWVPLVLLLAAAAAAGPLPAVARGGDAVAAPAHNARDDAFVPLRIRGAGRVRGPVARPLQSAAAARLDAAQVLADRVRALKLAGDRSIGELIAADAGFRAYVDAYLQQRSILSTRVHADGSSSAEAEVLLDLTFYRHLRRALQQSGGNRPIAASSAAAVRPAVAVAATPHSPAAQPAGAAPTDAAVLSPPVWPVVLRLADGTGLPAGKSAAAGKMPAVAVVPAPSVVPPTVPAGLPPAAMKPVNDAVPAIGLPTVPVPSASAPVGALPAANQACGDAQACDPARRYRNFYNTQ